MKVVKCLLGVNTLLVILFLSTTHLTSCIKIVHDTINGPVCNVSDGLIAHYTFTNGSLADESGNHNDIVFNSAASTADKNGVADNAYLFDGSTSYMTVPNSTSLNPTHGISMVAVVKPNDFYRGTCHFSEIIGKGSPDPVKGFYTLRIADPFGHCYEAADTTKEFFLGGYGDNIPEGTAAGIAGDSVYVHAQQWYTAIYTYDGHESKIYVNGQLVSTQKKTVSFTGNDHDLYIGRHEDPSFPYYFNGVIDEIRIYDKALSDCEIDKLCNHPAK